MIRVVVSVVFVLVSFFLKKRKENETCTTFEGENCADRARG
jgi:hypothetical protein